MDVSSLVETKKNPKIPDIAPGDTVKVSARIVEGGKERIQVFQGVVIKIKRGGNGAGFTVRHVAYGVGVERTFPFGSPLVEKVRRWWKKWRLSGRAKSAVPVFTICADSAARKPDAR